LLKGRDTLCRRSPRVKNPDLGMFTSDCADAASDATRMTRARVARRPMGRSGMGVSQECIEASHARGNMGASVVGLNGGVNDE
jgi:hypothetical protein